MSSPAASKRGGDSHNTKNIRNFVEYESAMILSKNTMERDKVRAKAKEFYLCLFVYMCVCLSLHFAHVSRNNLST